MKGKVNSSSYTWRKSGGGGRKGLPLSILERESDFGMQKRKEGVDLVVVVVVSSFFLYLYENQFNSFCSLSLTSQFLAEGRPDE